MAPPNQPPRAEAGVVIGGYELVRRLGRGGMAEVWVARRTLGAKGTKFVALKLIADHYVGDDRYTRMFRAEAELAAILSHANIVQVFDEGEDDGRSFLVMEWVDGLNLLKLGAVLALLDDEERRCRVISFIIGQLLYALGYAHSITSYDGSPLGVVHRDVSPQNVLVSNHGEVKLTDFGVAYYNVEESSGIHVKGKVRYMSPEQIGGKTRSSTVDLYAVGALLHELLDGKKFRSEYDDGQELFAAVISGEVGPLSRPVPRELDELRVRLLAPDPADRIQTAEEAIGWLQRYPGYGDARPELTKLCSSLTGVVKPRAGPGQSSQVPMVDQRTAQFGGSKGLAKPRVSPDSARATNPAARELPAQGRGVAAPPAASMAAAHEGARHSSTPAVITGETEFIKPQQLVGLGKKSTPAGPGASPSVRPPAIAAAPAPVLPLATSVPGMAPSPPMGAYASADPAPRAVGERHSYPIPIPTHAMGQAVAALAPTERLGPSETSGLRPNATEAMGASMFAELTSSSATDQEIPPMVAVRDGTDTSREISPMMQTSPSISIALPGRSGVAMLSVGLLLVAVMSVTITWWIFTPDKSKEDARVAVGPPSESVITPARQDPTPSAIEAKASPPPEPPAPVQPVQLAAGASDPVEESSAGQAVAPSGSEEPSPEGDPTTGGEDVKADPKLEGEPVALDDDKNPKASPAATPDDPPPSPGGETKKAPKATVIVSALPTMATGELVIGGTTIAIPKGGSIKKKVGPGKKKVTWRTDGKAWKSAPSIVLEPGKATKIHLTFTGPRVLP